MKRDEIAMDALTAIRARRSIGKLSGQIPREVIRELVELAVCAPNHRLTEPWRFTVLEGDARARLGRFWGELAARTVPAAHRDAVASAEERKLLRAPVVIVVSTRTDPDPVVATEDQSATAAAIENLLIAAHARGYGAIWRTGKMAYTPEVLTHLGLDPTDRIIGIVYLGEPAMEPEAKPRDVDAVLRWLDDDGEASRAPRISTSREPA